MNNQTKISVAILGILTTLFGLGLSSQSALAFTGASVFAPGIVDSQIASDISPGASEKGIEQHGRLPGGGCLAAMVSPGHLFRQEPTTTDINP